MFARKPLTEYSVFPEVCGSPGIAEVTHTSCEYPVTSKMLDQVRNRAFTSLQLIAEEPFAEGMARLEQDFAGGAMKRREQYTYIWGVRT